MNNLKILVRIDGHPNHNFYLRIEDDPFALEDHPCVFDNITEIRQWWPKLYDQIEEIFDGRTHIIYDEPIKDWDEFMAIYISEKAWGEEYPELY